MIVAVPTFDLTPADTLELITELEINTNWHDEQGWAHGKRSHHVLQAKHIERKKVVLRLLKLLRDASGFTALEGACRHPGIRLVALGPENTQRTCVGESDPPCLKEPTHLCGGCGEALCEAHVGG